jgi:hypothetical protein
MFRRECRVRASPQPLPSVHNATGLIRPRDLRLSAFNQRVIAYVERELQHQRYGRYLTMADMDIMSNDSSCVSGHEVSGLEHVRTHNAQEQEYTRC